MAFPTRTTIRLALCGATIVAAGAFSSAAHAQGGGPGSQMVVLPNPTPRPADPHDIFRDDPVARARQQQMLAVKRTQMHAQVVIDTNNILMLAQQIRNHHGTTPPSADATGSDIIGTEQIEKLAKRVKDNSKIQ